MAEFLAFGWPINYRSSSSPTPSKSNHSSAVRFPDAIDSFITTEISHGATAGPFQHNPFPTPIQTSPLQTVPKDTCKRRVVLDLSFPPGASVNDGIPTDSFLDEPFHLSLPRSADFVDLIIAKGPGCFLFKKDLKRAYRQIPVDPRDYIFLGYRIGTIFSILIWFFPSACVQPPSLANVLPTPLLIFSIQSTITSALITSMTLAA